MNTEQQPHDVDAERVVLDALMTNPDFASDTGITAEDYYVPRHQVIHAAIVALHATGRPTDPISVNAQLAAAGVLAKAGGTDYVISLFTSPLMGLARTHHFEIVIGKAKLRRFIETGMRMVQAGGMPGADPAVVVEMAESWISNLSNSLTVKGPVRWADMVDETLEYLGSFDQHDSGVRGLSTGLIDLDRLTGGFKPGQLVVIAGRPGAGKSIKAGDLARHVAMGQQVPTAMFSLEMSRIEMTQRIIAAQYEVLLDKLTNVRLSDADWAVLATALQEASDAPLWVDATPGQTWSHIRSNAHRLHRTEGIGMVILDHIGLVKSAESSRSENRQREVAQLSQACKHLAGELELPVVICCQLNRETEKRHDKRPQLSDLRESGAIEQDADIVLLLHRPDYYDKNDRPCEIDIEVAKNRSGPTGTVTAVSQLHFARFLDMHRAAQSTHSNLRGVA